MSKQTRLSRMSERRVKNEFKYYSFLLGLPNDPPQKWTFDDIRLPATNEKHALRVYRILTHPKLRYNKIEYDFKMPLHNIRKVVEFDKTEIQYTVWQFRFIQETTIF